MSTALTCVVSQGAEFRSASPELWDSLITGAAQEVFEVMVGVKLRPADAAVQRDGVTAMLGFAGKPCGVFSVRCCWVAATAIAARMLGVAPDELPAEQVCDAVGEICNMVAGSLKIRLSDAGAGCMMSTPTVVRGIDYEVRCLACDSFFECTLEFEGHLVSFHLELQAS